MITSKGVSGNGPLYFTVKDISGTIYEYGNTVDSRIITSTGSHVLTWRLNKVTDIHGNYMTYQYQFVNNESLLKEIQYTGNAALSITPYNKIQFNYATGRIDAKTLYEAGTIFKSNHVLTSIQLYGESMASKAVAVSSMIIMQQVIVLKGNFVVGVFLHYRIDLQVQIQHQNLLLLINSQCKSILTQHTMCSMLHLALKFQMLP